MVKSPSISCCVRKGTACWGTWLFYVPAAWTASTATANLSWGSAQGLMDTAPWARHLSKAGCTSKALWGSAQRNKPCSAVVRLNTRHSYTVQTEKISHWGTWWGPWEADQGKLLSSSAVWVEQRWNRLPREVVKSVLGGLQCSVRQNYSWPHQTGDTPAASGKLDHELQAFLPNNTPMTMWWLQISQHWIIKHWIIRLN